MSPWESLKSYKKINNTKLFVTTFIILIATSCAKYNNPHDVNPEDLFIQAKSGDTSSYELLKNTYHEYGSERFLDLAIFMADSLKYKEANIDVMMSYAYKYKFYFKVGDTIYLRKMSITDRKAFLKYLRISRMHRLRFDELKNYIKH